MKCSVWLNWLNDVRGFVTKRNRWQLSYQLSAVVSGRHDSVSKLSLAVCAGEQSECNANRRRLF